MDGFTGEPWLGIICEINCVVGRIASAAEKSMALRAPKRSIVDTHLVGVMDGFTGELTLSA
jgi:hypothetical protein